MTDELQCSSVSYIGSTGGDDLELEVIMFNLLRRTQWWVDVACIPL